MTQRSLTHRVVSIRLTLEDYKKITDIQDVCGWNTQKVVLQLIQRIKAEDYPKSADITLETPKQIPEV